MGEQRVGFSHILEGRQTRFFSPIDRSIGHRMTACRKMGERAGTGTQAPGRRIGQKRQESRPEQARKKTRRAHL